MYEKLIQSMVAQGLKDVATDPRLSANLFQVLTEEEQSRALKWIQQSVDKTQVVLGFRREVPTSPIISVTPSSEVETDPPIGMVGEDIIDAVTGQRVNLEGSWFEVSYRCLAQSPNADEVTYLVAIMRQTLLRYRPSLMNAGLFEQKISMTDLMPSEDYNDPNIEIFQRGIELSGTAFSGYDAVQSDGYTGIISDIPSATSVGALLTTYASPDTSTITFAASKITDTFVRGDNTTLLRTSSGHLWAPLSGTWGITSNCAYTVTPGADHRSLAVVTAIANGRAAMKMAPGTSLDASAGVSGFSAYRQIPERIGWNLVKNGGFLAPVGSEWTLHANASVVADSTSVTGYAFKLASTASGQDSTQDIPVEAGKAYSFALQVRGEGSATIFYFFVRWLDVTGAVITTAASPPDSNYVTAASWSEATVTNAVAAGNARSARIIIRANAAGTGYFSAMRVFQQTTAAPAWSSAHQQTVGNKGLCIYEAATNLLTNGDIESALSGTVDGFNDPFADRNAWTTVIGSAVAVAGNIMTLGTGDTAVVAGHAEWWDIDWDIRFNLSVGSNGYVYLRDIGNIQIPYTMVRIILTPGGTISLQRWVAGVGPTSPAGPSTAVTAAATWYWVNITISGTTWTVTLYNDNAGAKGGAVAGGSFTWQEVNPALAVGHIGLQANGGTGVQYGGAFANVCRVRIAKPGSHTVQVIAGVPAFCVSKTNKFSGTYSLSIYNNSVGADGRWIILGTFVNGVTYTESARMKLASVVSANGAGLYTTSGGDSFASAETGTSDWHVYKNTFVAGGAGNLNCVLQNATGTAWFDQLWEAQQVIDTGNADLSGQAYVPTGFRAGTDATMAPLPSGFNIADFSRVVAVRFDHAYNAYPVGVPDRYIWDIYVTGPNRLSLAIDTTSGQIRFYHGRNNTFVAADDQAVTAFAAGDTLVIGVRHSPSVGLELQISKNGGAIATYTNASTEAKTSLSGTPTMYVGRYGGSVTNQPNLTLGIDRILPAGYTAAQVAAVMALAYAVNVVTPRNDWRYDGAQALDGGGTVGARLAFRFTDKDNGFYVEAQPGQYALLKVAGGVLTTIGTYAKAPKPGDQVMVSLASSSISVFVNGAIALAVSQTFNQTGTLHGIGATDTSLATWTGFTWS